MEKTALSSKKYKEIEFLPMLPRAVMEDASKLLSAVSSVLVPVTLNSENRVVLYLEGAESVMVCRALLEEDVALEYLDEIANHSSIEDLELKYCPLTIGKLVSSLSNISKKANKPVKCMLMVKHDGEFYDVGVLWTNHEPLMV